MSDPGSPFKAPEPAPLAPPVSYLPQPARPDLATTDIPCISCGYNLRGLPDSGSCPECGTAVARSLLGNLLVFSGPAYVESLRRGATIVWWSLVFTIVVLAFTVLVQTATSSFRPGPSAPPGALDALAALLNAAVSIAFYLGWWLLSEPDPAYVGRETGATARRVLRISAGACAIGNVLATMAQLVLPALGSGSVLSRLVEGAAVVGGIGGLIAWIVLFFASMRYVQWLAPRIPDNDLGRSARRLMWLGPLLSILVCVIGWIISLVLYWRLVGTIRRDLAAIRSQQEGRSGP
jgi:hypothetical protein